jgi:hypothetical protein
MDQHSIRRHFLLYLFISSFFYNGFFAVSNDVKAGELTQIAQSGDGEEGDDEDDEDC